MTFRVVVTQQAKDDLRHYYSLAAEHAPETAQRWLDRFEVALGSLAEHPQRCPLAPENNLVEETIRQYFFGKGSGRFRALFTVRDPEVMILHVRRGSMDQATAAELTE